MVNDSLEKDLFIKEAEKSEVVKALKDATTARKKLYALLDAIVANADNDAINYLKAKIGVK